jgi:alkylation response protein AidB-like acyl-CoA dehydrogenase
MDFAFSEEQQMAAESVRAALADLCTGADLRRLMASGEARDPRRWDALNGLGLSGLMVAEDLGGLGLAETDLVLMAEACGHACLPEPLVENAGVAAPLLAAFAADPRAAAWLERVVNGEATAAVGHPANPFVGDADTAGVLLVARDDGLHLVESAAARLTRHESIDPFRRLFTVDFDASAATRLADAGQAAPALALALDRAALFAAAQGLGLAQRAVEMAADYAKERTQFGKPIGANQAIKHLLANCQTAIVFARPVVHAAAAQIGQQDLFSRARVSHAKLAALSAASLAARTAIQVHGAMGYSWEVDVHFYLKRALALTGAWGDEAFHRARVAERAHGAPLGPRHTFARAQPAPSQN